MLCPHCNQNLLYKERSGRKCSKCRREFAFEPKTDALGLHDKRFLKAVAKLGADGKLYFTSGQLQHFLSRKKIKNSFSSVRVWLFFIGFVAFAATIFLLMNGSAVALLSLVILVAAIIISFILASRQSAGALSLPQSSRAFEETILGRWQAVYRQLPANLLSNRKTLPKPQNPETVRAALVCAEPEILNCLSANRTDENLGLLLLNAAQPEKAGLEFIQNQSDLPVFVLHDASAEGCLLKEKFASAYLAGKRKVYDLGLRPATAIKTNSLRLRRKMPETDGDKPSGLTPEENAWLNGGNYTPLLALTPTRLIKLVTRGVNGRFEAAVKTDQKAVEKTDRRAAQSVGFMTWFGE